MVKLRKNSLLQTEFTPVFSPALDTLAELGKSPLKSASEGTLKNLQKRARSKWYTTAIVGRLVYLESPLHKYYQRAFYCAHTLKQEGNKITTKYCNTRVCHVCNRIRTAQMMKGYINQLMELKGLDFVTLTLPNCKDTELAEVVDLMQKEWVKIVGVLKKRKTAISGIRKIEVTYNYREDTYHPHLHILVSDSKGQMVVDEWLKRFPTASIKAQNTKKADKGSLAEIFKYATKVVSSKKKEVNIYIPALDKIMIALFKRRCFQPFGKIKKVSEDVEDLNAVEYSDLPVSDLRDGQMIEWIWNECDWVRSDVYQTLTGYVPPEIEFNYLE